VRALTLVRLLQQPVRAVAARYSCAPAAPTSHMCVCTCCFTRRWHPAAGQTKGETLSVSQLGANNAMHGWLLESIVQDGGRRSLTVHCAATSRHAPTANSRALDGTIAICPLRLPLRQQRSLSGECRELTRKYRGSIAQLSISA